MAERIAIRKNDRVFILTGAGISAESGIPTFRGVDGLWNKFRIEELASPEAWERDPELVWKFSSYRRRTAAPCAPNAAHRALAELEQQIGDRLFVCTQNVDDLHERAGSSRVVHMHGELFKSRCDRCDREPFEDKAEYETVAVIPKCECGGRIRPHICWFGEMPFEMERIAEELERCTVFGVIGTSGVVYPAAGFVHTVNQRYERGEAAVRTFYVGPERPENAGAFEEILVGKAGEVVPGMFTVSR
jgi:NAD-dependent deacetylase